MLTDPISDMITRIKNGLMVKKNEVIIPFSKLKENVTKILKQENFIKDYKKIKKGKKEYLMLSLRYKNNISVISEIKRISKPSRKFYVGQKDMSKLTRGFGYLILSTSRGVMTDKKAKQVGVGGEVICRIW